jgi:hypothetical protein
LGRAGNKPVTTIEFGFEITAPVINGLAEALVFCGRRQPTLRKQEGHHLKKSVSETRTPG